MLPPVRSFRARASAAIALIALLCPQSLLAEPAKANADANTEANTKADAKADARTKAGGLLSMRSKKVSLNLEPSLPPPPPADTQTVLVPKPATSPMNIKLGVDIPIVLGAAAGMFLPQMLGSRAQPPATLRTDQINGMDRGVVGNWSPLADQISTGLLATSIVLPVAASLIDTWVNKPADGYWGFAKDTLVLAETYAITSMLTNIVKISVNRPRPYVYNLSLPDDVRNNSDATHSFFSGHSSTAFAMATAYSYMFMLRHPDSKLVIPMWIGTEALAATTAFLRVQAGQHFWSDVLVGAAAGTAIGFLVPYLHKKDNFFSRLFFGRKDDPHELHLTTVGAGLGVAGKF